MKRQDLESINNELFQALDLEDQKYIIGTSNSASGTGSYNPQTGGDADVDYQHDWS